MKIIVKKSFIILYVIIFLFSSCKKEIVYTDYQYLIENPKGDVKSVKISFYSADDKFGEIVKDYPDKYKDVFDDNINYRVMDMYSPHYKFTDNSYVYSLLLRFNENGNLIEKEALARNGEIKEKKIIIWGDNKLPTDIRTYNKNGDLIKRVSFEYDKYNNVIKFFNSESHISYRKYKKNRLQSDSTVVLNDIGSPKNGDISVLRYIYSKINGKTFRKTTKNTDNEDRLTSLFEYDKNDNLLFYEYYWDDGKPNWKKYAYNQRGNITLIENIYWKGEYIFNKNGRIIEEIETLGEDVQKTLFSYDEKGFLQKKVEFEKYGLDEEFYSVAETLYSYELDEHDNILKLIINWDEFYDMVECEYEYYK